MSHAFMRMKVKLIALDHYLQILVYSVIPLYFLFLASC